MKRSFVATTLILLIFGLASAQSTYKGLTPGRSTRAEVERVLGRPAKTVSATLIEYRPQPLTSKIFVQYRVGSPVVERIEVLCRLENSTCKDFTKSLNLRLPEPESAKVPELGGGKYNVFYYGAPHYAAATIDDAGFDNNEIVPFRIAFYSRELYEAAKKGNEAAISQAEEDQKKPPPLSGSYGEITGIVKLRATDGSLRPVAGATVDFYRTDNSPGTLKTNTDKHGIFVGMGLSQTAPWVVVVSGPGIKWAYLNGVRTPVAGLEIVAEPGDGSRPTLQQVMAAIR
jgi:hypothetical protein